jgi:hypothetical protein
MSVPAIFGALKYIPASVGVKALEKLSPMFKNYFSRVAAYGLDTNRALDYLKDRFENEASQDFQSQLNQGEQAGTLRPDEKAAKSQISNAKAPGKIARTIASLGGGLIGASAGQGKADQGVTKTNEPMTKPEEISKVLSPREEALQKYNRMKKQKSTIDQLQGDFEKEYGPGLRETQAPANASDDELLALMQKILKS